MHVRIGRLLIAAVGIVAAVVATGTAAPAAPAAAAVPAVPAARAAAGSLPRPAADHPELRGANARVRGEVRGLTGAAASALAGEAATRFLALTRGQISTTLAAQALHTAWGTAFDQPQAQGISATHSVLTNNGTTTRGGEYIYSPTSLSPGGACIEMTTAYTPSGPLLWAWDWCGGRSGVGKALTMNSAFRSAYTTTVNGLPAYSFQVSKTNASTNEWTAYLYNYQTHAFQTFYTSAGSYDLGDTWFGWNMFEIYSSIEPSTGVGYYCTDMAGQGFDASAIQVELNGAWQPATPSNSYSYGTPPPSGSSFQCPTLTFTMNSPYNHWSARIAG